MRNLSNGSTSLHPLPLVYSATVASARESGRPLVALESTIITHGMPWPQNVETARQVEATVRDAGAEPATIAVMEGVIRIGLDDHELEALAKAKNVMKLSRADFAFAIAQKKTGSTTVAATMIAANLAGISVFATGGIGGAHQGAETSFDISADLDELARTDVTVVCAGAKAILDLNKTLEILETKGVPVVSYATDILPAFWSRDSGIATPLRLDTAQQIAEFTRQKRLLGLTGGVLIANSAPSDSEIPRKEMDQYISDALHHAELEGIFGKSLTPFLLHRIFELSDGKSLETNIALVLNNARLAAQIAVEESKYA